jgi:hypothetical protein
MPEEGFLRRWARVKATGIDPAVDAPPAPAPVPAQAPAPTPPAARWARAGDVSPAPADSGDAGAALAPPAAPGRPSPTLEDVARLTPDSDYSIFVGQGVDKSVQRLALKKLFSDPHFNVMDRLDMYMDDYNIPSPVSEAMLASLDHARSALRRVVEEPGAVAPTPDPAATVTDAAATDAISAPPAATAPPQSPLAGAGDHEAVPHNEAAHASAAHEDPLPGDTPCCEPTHEYEHKRGSFHRPDQKLPQGQV